MFLWGFIGSTPIPIQLEINVFPPETAPLFTTLHKISGVQYSKPYSHEISNY